MNKITKQELLNSKSDKLTMKDLRKFVENNTDIIDSTPILIERIEDKYFEDKGWKVLLVEGWNYSMIKEFNEKMKLEIELRKLGRGEYDEKLNPEECISELTDDLKEQFFPAWCISKDNDNSVVYIFNQY